MRVCVCARVVVEWTETKTGFYLLNRLERSALIEDIGQLAVPLKLCHCMDCSHSVK